MTNKRSKTAWLTLTFPGALLLCTALIAGERPLDGDVVHGEVLFKKYCASCHGKQAQGGKDAPRLTEGGRINALSDAAFLRMLKGESRGKGLHKGLKKGFALLDAWDIIGFLRSHVPYVGEMFPKADRYIVKNYGVDKHARARLKTSLARDVKDAECKADVFTLFDTGTGEPLSLVPQDPRLIDGLKRRMKVGYVIFMPFAKPGGGKAQLALALEPKFLKISSLYAVNAKGKPERDLNKLLSRFRDKGDRRLSGKPKARLAVGGGGRQIKDLEQRVTDVYLRCLEMVTSYEIEERERSWADDDVMLDDPDPDQDDFSVK